MFFVGGMPGLRLRRAAVVTMIALGQCLGCLAAKSEKLKRVFTALLVANPDGFLNP
jgi:hypothetical protein